MILRFYYLLLLIAITRQASLDNVAWRDKCAALSRYPCLENKERWESGLPCIEYAQVCDGTADCPDGRDEMESICGSTNKPEPNIPTDLSTPAPDAFCAENFFKCKSNTLKEQFIGAVQSAFCIPKRWRCDGEKDCLDGSDEDDCTSVTCNEYQMKCKSKETPTQEICISKSWVCDGETDCYEGVDEKDCTTLSPLFSLSNYNDRIRPIFSQNCSEDEFKCANGFCIYENWKCDGHNDCGDNSDEVGCLHDVTKCNDATQFTCVDNHYCVPKHWRCDNQHDCLDGSDEHNCDTYQPYINHTTHHTESKCASEHEFACLHDGGECILQIWLCDNDADCAGGEDENVTLCLARQKLGLAPNYKVPDTSTPKPQPCTIKQNQFQCVGDGTCISLSLLCDGKYDCSDLSDESHTICRADKNCSESQFDCYNNGYRCLNYSQVCDGNIDCPMPGGKDGADETVALCYAGSDRKDGKRDCNTKNGGCEQLCIANNTGFCQCKPGYQLTNSTSCEDKNECEMHYGVCAQKCVNTKGSYSCECHKDYELQSDKRSCKAKGDDPLLLLANRENIRQVDLRTKEFEPLVDNLTSAIAVDYHMKDQIIVWTDVHQEKIFKCNMKNKSSTKKQLLARMEITSDCKTVLAEDRVMTPDGIAVDWIHDLVFWTDTGFDTINVLDLKNASHRVVLFDDKLSEPRAIAVDPKMGLIFWTDWGDEAKIERAGMNGADRKIIVNTNLTWPNGLALDLLEKRVYWADAKLKRIESCDYNGGDRKVIMQGDNVLHHPFSISVFEEKLYWTDWDTEGVHTANKFNGRDHDLLIHGLFGIMSIRVWHTQTQPSIPNRCLKTTCAHLCLPTPAYNQHQTYPGAPVDNLKKASFECKCSDGFETQDSAMRCKDLKSGKIDQSGLLAIEKEILTMEEISILNGSSNLSTDSGSTIYVLFIVIVLILAALGFIYYRRNVLRSAFTNIPVNFDNPIYRHTTTQDDERVFFDEPPGPCPELNNVSHEYHDDLQSMDAIGGDAIVGHQPFDQGRTNLTEDFE